MGGDGPLVAVRVSDAGEAVAVELVDGLGDGGGAGPDRLAPFSYQNLPPKSSQFGRWQAHLFRLYLTVGCTWLSGRGSVPPWEFLTLPRLTARPRVFSPGAAPLFQPFARLAAGRLQSLSTQRNLFPARLSRESWNPQFQPWSSVVSGADGANRTTLQSS